MITDLLHQNIPSIYHKAAKLNVMTVSLLSMLFKLNHWPRTQLVLQEEKSNYCQIHNY